MSNLDTLTGLVGDASSQHKSLQADAKKLSEKWEKTGLLEGLDGYDKNSMSIPVSYTHLTLPTNREV